jgi:hypothetical protein
LRRGRLLGSGQGPQAEAEQDCQEGSRHSKDSSRSRQGFTRAKTASTTSGQVRATKRLQLFSPPARFQDTSSPMVEPPVLDTGCL